MAKYSANVVIIGAGVAGITAAARLVNSGLDDVVVLEAQGYTGGRVKGEIVDGKNIDLGAQFIHGREGNPAYEIAHKLGIVVYPDSEFQSRRLQNIPREYFTTKGEKVPSKKVLHFVEFLYDELDRRFDKPLEEGANDGDLFEQAYYKFQDLNKNKFSQEDIELYNAVYRWHIAYHKIDNAVADLKDLSVWGASKYVVLKGDRFTTAHGGMVALFNAILDLVPKEIIKLNTPVAKVDWSAVSGSTTDGTVLVSCKNGDVIKAKHVIVTVSTGYLQAFHKELIYPSLPSSFQTALYHIGFGCIGKIFLKWEKPFWNVHGTSYFKSFELLWLDTHPVTFLSDKSQKKTRFGKPWWHGIQSVETVIDHPNMLEFWLTRDQAEVVEELDNDEMLNVCHELLQFFLRDYENIPKPLEIYRTKWLSNPYVRGTYSYPKFDLREEDMDSFGTPLPSKENPRVLFAGEAYSIDFISTFHGAFLSGQKQSDLILKTQGLKTSQKLIDLIGTKKSKKSTVPHKL